MNCAVGVLWVGVLGVSVLGVSGVLGMSGVLGVSGVLVAAWLLPFRILSSVTVNSENNRKVYIYKGINKHARNTEPRLEMINS